MNCENCNSKLEQHYNFCPICSTPLTENAKRLEQDKMINAQLVVLASLIKEIDNKESLKKIEKFITKLSDL